MKIRFTIPGIPIAQPRQHERIVRGSVRRYVPKKHPVHAFKDACRLAFNQAYRGDPLDVPVAVQLRFVLPRPRALRWKSKPMPRVWHHRKPDIDNLQKSVIDALNGFAWRDDACVSVIEASKEIAAGDESPGVEVMIVALAAEG